jgi:hypothetical protein
LAHPADETAEKDQIGENREIDQFELIWEGCRRSPLPEPSKSSPPCSTRRSASPSGFNSTTATLPSLFRPVDFQDLCRLRIQELIEITERSGAYAEAQGMTDELLKRLLADESGTRASLLTPMSSLTALFARPQFH